MNAINPFMRGEPPSGGLLQLEQHVARLNNYNWVQASGKLYYVAKRTKADGMIEHFVDRHI